MHKSKIFYLFVLFAICFILANPILMPGVWKDITPSGLTLATGNGNCLTYMIVIDPSNSSTLYLTTTTNFNMPNIWKSTDAGSTWKNLGVRNGITKGLAFGDVRVDPKNPLHLYTIAEQGEQEGFWISNDGGVSWTQPAGFMQLVLSLTQGHFISLYDIAVDPKDFSHVLITSKQPVPVVAESKDAGLTWVVHNVPLKTVTADFNIFFLYNPALGIGDKNTWLFTSFYDGCQRTTDGGITWTEVIPAKGVAWGIPHQQIYYAKKTKILYMGNQPYPLRSNDNGVTWQQILAAGLAPGYGYFFTVMGDGENLYTAHSNLWGYMQGPTVTSKETDGLIWTPYNNGMQVLTNGPMNMVFDAANGIMYSTNLYGLLALKVVATAANTHKLTVSKRALGLKPNIVMGKAGAKSTSRKAETKNKNEFYDALGAEM